MASRAAWGKASLMYTDWAKKVQIRASFVLTLAAQIFILSCRLRIDKLFTTHAPFLGRNHRHFLSHKPFPIMRWKTFLNWSQTIDFYAHVLIRFHSTFPMFHLFGKVMMFAAKGEERKIFFRIFTASPKKLKIVYPLTQVGFVLRLWLGCWGAKTGWFPPKASVSVRIPAFNVLFFKEEGLILFEESGFQWNLPPTFLEL